jgi:REP element-mobilizing transposase RayT
MPRPRKLHLNQTVLLITSSIEEGLLMPQNPLIISILKSCLALAQFHYPVKICHFVFEANHFHLILLVDDPDLVKGFMERFKTESAHAINRLLGRGKRTVWCAGYDSPVLLTVDDVIAKIVYLYTNPSRDSLADSIDQYVGLHSYNYIQNNKLEIDCPIIRRPQISALEDKKYTVQDFRYLANGLENESKLSCKLVITPDAWTTCFPEISDANEINQRIYDLIKLAEDEYYQLRIQKNQSVPSPSKLQSENFNLEYQSKRQGRRTFCISANKDLRRSFIRSVRSIIEKANEIYQKWLKGDFSIPYPLGLYPPSQPKQAHLISALKVL